MKLWGGRFQKDTDLLVNELNASISFDQRLYREDITGSMAHAAMLADCGIISKEDAAAITSGLEDILADIEAGKAAFTADNEDIHMNVEALLTARIGDAGKRLHTARSRNDQVALDFRMYVREQIPRHRGAAAGAGDGPLPSGEEAPDRRDARLHPSPAGAAHLLCPASDGLCRHVPPGRDPAGGLRGPAGRVSPGIRRPGGHHLSHRPVGRRQRPWASPHPWATPWTASATGTTRWSF